MGKFVNMPKEELILRLDHQAHVALAFRQDKKRIDYIGFECEGPQQLFSSSVDAFTRLFKTEHDADAVSFVPKMLKSVKRAYLPGANVAAILLEVLKMTTINDKEMKDCSTKELVEHFNALRKTENAEPITEKTYKSKAKLIEAIEKFEASLIHFTPDQQTNKKANAAAAEKRLAGLASLKEQKAEEAELKRSKKADKAKSTTTTKEADMATKDTSKTAKKPAAKAAPAKKDAKPAAKPAAKPVKKADKGESKPRGTCIGAFCIELILKGKSNEETASTARDKFGSSTSASSVAWYRNKLKGEGKLK